MSCSTTRCATITCISCGTPGSSSISWRTFRDTHQLGAGVPSAGDTAVCGDEDSALSSVNIASAMLWCKVLLICWGFAKGGTQLLLTGAFGVEQPSNNSPCNIN